LLNTILQADIIKHLPKIVSMLNGKQEEKNIVRSVFSSILSTASGTISSNLPRVRQSELLTPSELMIVLHEADEGIRIKAAIEGSFPSLVRQLTYNETSFVSSDRHLLLYG
jgi:symplekin